MRKFRLISEDYAGLEYGKIYDSDFVISDDFRTVEYYNDMYPSDWEEVFEEVFDEPKTLHKGIIVSGHYNVESAIRFVDVHQDNLAKLGYYLIAIPSDESYVKLLSAENVSETDLNELMELLKK